MGARLRAYLTAEEDRTLFEIRTADTVPQRVKDRAETLRLSQQGLFIEKISAFFDWHPQTVRNIIHRWRDRGLGSLWDGPSHGQKRRWDESDMEYLEQLLRQQPRSYNSKQLAQKLAQERHVHLSPSHLREVLKKRGSFGSELDTATGISKIQYSDKSSSPI